MFEVRFFDVRSASKIYLYIFQGNADLSQINYPAITLCSQASSKYAIAERLSNFMDPGKDLPLAFRTIRNEFLICATGIYAYMKKWTTSLQSSNTCLNTDNPAEGCKVYVQNFLLKENHYKIIKFNRFKLD